VGVSDGLWQPGAKGEQLDVDGRREESGRGVDVRALEARRDELLGRVGARATERAYAADWADYLEFWRRMGRPMKTTAEALSVYLIDAGGRGLSLYTLRRRVTGIRRMAARAGLPVPEAREAWTLLAGLARAGVGRPRPKRALTVDELVAMVAACGDEPLGRRDRALVLLGFAAGLRRSELCALDLADVRYVRQGVELSVRRSKTDQAGAGRTIGVYRGAHPATDPVRALKAWLEARGGWAGPLFVGWRGRVMLRGRMEPGTVARVVRRLAGAAGVDAGELAGHSLRAGCVTAAVAAGASLVEVMERTGHKSVVMLQRYYRPAGAWAGRDVLGGVL
jgi:integrase